MANYPAEPHRPFIGLLYLLLLAVGGAVIFTILAFAAGIAVYGIEVITQSNDYLSGSNPDGLDFLKMVQIASTIGTFILPAIVFARLQSPYPLNYLRLDRLAPVLVVGLVVALMFASAPLLEWTIMLNKQMKLPGFLHGVEEWMKAKEDQLAYVTQQLLVMKSPGEYLVNMLMIAVLPAIGEELIFRGCLQRIFSRWTNSAHWGIWLAAIVFSAIHMQFYGFFPRMLLGALFGYLLLWTDTLWLPILAHFINNGTAVTSAFLYQRKGESLDNLDQPLYSGSSSMYLFSAIFTGFLLWYIYRRSLDGAESVRKNA